MDKPSILIIEDESDIRELIAFNLDLCGYNVLKAADGLEGLEAAKKELPQLILLDLMLPEIDGFEVCKKLKSQDPTRSIPIIMLTARSEDEHMVKGLELGADDYVTKPFSPQVLVARVKAVLRRNGSGVNRQPENSILSADELSLDPGRHEVILKGQQLALSATEFSILQFLIENRGWVFSRNQIIDAIKGEDYPVTARSIDVQIVGLRKKLMDYGNRIETIRGVGYKFKGD